MTVPASLPLDESSRLEALRALMVLDTPAEPLLDSIARMAAEVCGVPIALISLVDAERQWFKANVGLTGVNETPRDVAFCAHAICTDDVMEVTDATQDPRFAGNPLVTGTPDIRFYAGAPLMTGSDGNRVGTLCVIDRQTRQLTPEQRTTLRSLSVMASQALDMRRNLVERAFSVRQEYEKALADSEQRYRTMVEAQTELQSLAWPNGDLFFVNQAYARHFSIQAHEMVGESLYNYVQPSDRDLVRERIAEVFRIEGSTQGENGMLTADGTERWVAWTNTFLRDSQQRPCLHSVGRDITAQKMAERALLASQQLLERTGRVARVGGWEFDVRSGAVSWSAETLRIHEVPSGYQPDLKTTLNFYGPEAKQAMADAVRRALDAGQPWDLELPLVTATGRHIWVRAVGEAEYDGDAVVRLFVAVQDVTERRRMEQRVADSERFVRLVTDGLPIRVGYVDRHLRFRFVNQAVCDLFGRSRDDIIGRTRDELVGAPTPDDVRLRVQRVLEGTAQRFEFDEVRDGIPLRIESQLVPDISERGRVKGFFFTGIDITQRAEAERGLRVLTAILEHTSDFVVQASLNGQVTYMNPAARRIEGFAPDADVTGHIFSEFNTPETNALYVSDILPTVRTHNVWVGETTVYGAQKQEIRVSHMVMAHRDLNGRVQHFSAIMRDISEAVRARQALMRQTATLRSITEALPSQVSVVGADRRFQFVNSAFERWYGLARDQIIGRTLEDLWGAAAYSRLNPLVTRALMGETLTFDEDFPDRDPPSNVTVHLIPLWSDHGQVDGFVSMAQDVTSHRQEAGRLLELAQRDPLTGLLNRAGLQAYVQHRLMEGAGPLLAMLCIDLDHFKPVNDEHGHLVGDQLLQMFGERLRMLVRPTDAVARLGGDEFALLLNGVRERSHAESVARKIVDAAHVPFELGTLRLSVGASVGLALGLNAGQGFTDLMARADRHLYAAKRSGRGRLSMGEPPEVE
ncbi:MAG: PAS domain S-box protein [Acidovorax sp.]|nr:PAS domain S-box protein [Acidovorax sp.]